MTGHYDEKAAHEKLRSMGGQIVDTMFLSVADVLDCRVLYHYVPKARAICSVIMDWFDAKAALEADGRTVKCAGCDASINKETIVGGFVIAVPIIDGGFEAKQAAAIVTSVCRECVVSLDSDPDKIILHVMSKQAGGVPVNVAPGSDRDDN